MGFAESHFRVEGHFFWQLYMFKSGPGSLVGIATGYGLECPGIEPRWGRDFPHLSRPAHPASCTMGTGSFPGVKGGRGVTLTPHPLLVPLVMKEYCYTSTPPMGRTACTELQCLYKGAPTVRLSLRYYPMFRFERFSSVKWTWVRMAVFWSYIFILWADWRRMVDDVSRVENCFFPSTLYFLGPTLSW